MSLLKDDEFYCFTVGNPSHAGIELSNLSHVNKNSRGTHTVETVESYGEDRAQICRVYGATKRHANEILIFLQVGIPAGYEDKGVQIIGGKVYKRCLLKIQPKYPEIFLAFLISAAPGEQVVVYTNDGNGFSDQLVKLNILLPLREENEQVLLGLKFEVTHSSTLTP